MTTQLNPEEISENEKAHKIEMLRQMILNAEKTMQSAKAMLLQMEGKKKTGRKRKLETEEGDGTIVEGTFDGQIMHGTDGRQYPVPANYASKSKLVEGDLLKLNITADGSFVYKQIGPANRKSIIGIVSQDEKGNYFILSEGKPYRVLLASITYFKAEPGDEVVIMTARDLDCTWAAIENVLAKGGEIKMSTAPVAKSVEKTVAPVADDFGEEEITATTATSSSNSRFPSDGGFNSWKKELTQSTPAAAVAPVKKPEPTEEELEDEWTSDIADLEKEIAAQQQTQNKSVF
ncbi:MAG: hypothetical protein WCJ51_04520 [Candidatus Moraniibacteriota bacterium]